MYKNPAYKSVNSSSMRFVESSEPKLIKVEPKEKVEKNPAYKNINSSSMRYVEPSPNIVAVTKPTLLPTTSYNYCVLF